MQAWALIEPHSEPKRRQVTPSLGVFKIQLMIIERLQAHQADDVAILIKRNLLEVISQYYPPDYVAYLLDCFSSAQMLENAKNQDIFVVTEQGKAIGTGSLANFGTEELPSYYGTAIFVLPEYHGKGIGKQIMQKLESTAVEKGAKMITIRAAINARVFYEKLGYTYRNGVALQDEKGNFEMEKVLHY
jgi:GNAT superfamily N-acetyltransferase